MLEVMKQRIADEIDRLVVELTETLPRVIQKAAEHGDLKENAEYKYALERQQFVQARLNHLTQRAGELSRINADTIPTDRVGFGSRVRLRDADSGEEVEYTIVFGDYIDLEESQISMASPMGSALLGHARNDEVTVSLPRGDRKFRIVDLVTLHEMVAE